MKTFHVSKADSVASQLIPVGTEHFVKTDLFVEGGVLRIEKPFEDFTLLRINSVLRN